MIKINKVNISINESIIPFFEINPIVSYKIINIKKIFYIILIG